MTRADPLTSPVEAILLDAGGVLLDLDYAYLRRLIEPCDVSVTVGQLAAAEAHARREVNRTVSRGQSTTELWRDYFGILLARVEVPPHHHEKIIDSLWGAHRRIGLWTAACEGAAEAVARLKTAGYRLGVVSNAEGQVARDLDNAGYRDMFEIVVDSTLVGVAKPDPAIFAVAVEHMKLRREATVFVGDLPAVDVKGARAAGLTPVLLDRHGLYPDADVVTIRSLDELTELVRR